VLGVGWSADVVSDSIAGWLATRFEEVMKACGVQEQYQLE